MLISTQQVPRTLRRSGKNGMTQRMRFKLIMKNSKEQSMYLLNTRMKPILGEYQTTMLEFPKGDNMQLKVNSRKVHGIEETIDGGKCYYISTRRRTRPLRGPVSLTLNNILDR